MNVVAQLTSPSGSTVNVPLTDADGTGNYQAALPYNSGGEYQVSFVFTNPNNTAVETNAGFDYTPDPNGASAPLSCAAGQPAVYDHGQHALYHYGLCAGRPWQ